MQNQPHQPTPDQPLVPISAVVYLVVSVISVMALVFLAILGSAGVMIVPRGLSGLLAATVAVGGCGYIIRSSQAQIRAGQLEILDRIEQMEQRLEEHRQEGYAEGFVAATSGGRPLAAVSQR